ncbi:MAG: hypothetical protein K5917_06370 [Clostridiales bacterium]|nr:hypothetical protein [Clostridiales bacterium]
MPEIDRGRWAEELKEQIRSNGLKSKDLINIGAETSYEQKINKYKNGAIPSIDWFLSLCRFLTSSPDSLLFANPKWVECDFDFWNSDIPENRLLGTLDDVCYVVPFNENEYEDEDQWSYFNKPCHKITILKNEPDPSKFLDFHISAERYDLNERVENGKIVYRFPCVNDEKTSEKIFSLLEKKKFSNKQMQALLDLSSQSITNRKNKNVKSKWTINDIYKLSWILNVPFEGLVEIDYREDTRESVFDAIVYILHYQGAEEEKDEEAQLER